MIAQMDISSRPVGDVRGMPTPLTPRHLPPHRSAAVLQRIASLAVLIHIVGLLQSTTMRETDRLGRMLLGSAHRPLTQPARTAALLTHSHSLSELRRRTGLEALLWHKTMLNQGDP